MTSRDDTGGGNRANIHAAKASRLSRLLVGVALALIAAIGIEQLGLTEPFPLTYKLLQTQDAPVLVGVSALMLALAAFGAPTILGRWLEPAAGRSFQHVFVPIALAAVAVVAGTKFIALDFALSRDEIMALFDSKIIASGRLLAPVPVEWREFLPALQPEFRLAVPGNVVAVSSYLPGNAAIRAVLNSTVGSALGNAILAVVALVAVLGVSRRLWPQQPDAHVVAVLLAATSSQLLFMSMTPYAMSAHLALNLVWLWLFVRNTALSHALAIATGFMATGLHQLVFHPLFAAPFILQLLLDRRWMLGSIYTLGYGAIGIFWIVYWQLLLASGGIAPEAASAMGLSYFMSRVASMLSYFNLSGIETMVQNLLRFAAWQNPMLLVLLVPGMAVAWRANGVLRSLAVGIVLTILAMFILLPYQDIGWGYRYIHGLIGNAVLLATAGWIELTRQATLSDRQQACGVLGVLTAAATLILAPLHASHMHGMIAPSAKARAAILSSESDAVIVDTSTIYYGGDYVRNDPDLRNRPLTFDLGLLNEPQVRELCARFRLSIFDGRDAARFGVVENPRNAAIIPLLDLIKSPTCRNLYRGG